VESGDAKLAERVKHNYAQANLPPRSKALAKFADLVTRAPAAVRKQDVDALRKHGLTDRDILDAVEVVADALGIDPEPEMRAAFENKPK
jgi:uncharacterized peroxidase-related enzyme